MRVPHSHLLCSGSGGAQTIAGTNASSRSNVGVFFIFNFADTSKWRYRATGLNAVADVVEDAHLV